MERASEELDRRSRYLSSLIKQQRINPGNEGKEREAEEGEVLVVVKDQRAKEETQRKRIVDSKEQHSNNVRVRAVDMPVELQRRAFRCARHMLGSMPKLDSKSLALTLKKVAIFGSTLSLLSFRVLGTIFKLRPDFKSPIISS